MLMDARALQNAVISSVITARVDLSLPREAVLRLGGYTYIDDGITDGFFHGGLGVDPAVDNFKLIRIVRPMDVIALDKWLYGMREEVQTVLTKRYAGANIRQLSALLAKYPAIGNHSIVLSGSRGPNASGEPCVAAFVGYGNHRALRLHLETSIYPEGWLVLACPIIKK